MAGTSAAVFGAIYDIIPTLDPEVQVLYGTRASQLNPDVVGVTAITTDTTRPTLGSIPRSREEAHEVTVVSSVFRPGPDTQRETVEQAYAYIDRLAEWLRVGTNPTLGLGGNVDGFVSSSTLDIQADNEELQAMGRYAAVTATLTVTAYRI